MQRTYSSTASLLLTDGRSHMQGPMQLPRVALQVGILLEELQVPYDAHLTNISNGEQFSAEFVRVNPNSKIPCLTDRQGPDGAEMAVFESGSIMLYLADKFGKFMPATPRGRQEVMNWLFWYGRGV